MSSPYGDERLARDVLTVSFGRNTVRIHHLMQYAGVRTLEDLVRRDDPLWWRRQRGMGVISFAAIKRYLHRLGYRRWGTGVVEGEQYPRCPHCRQPLYTKKIDDAKAPRGKEMRADG